MRCSFFPGLASGLCTAKVIGLADSRESPDIYIHSRTELRLHARIPRKPIAFPGKIGGSGNHGTTILKTACLLVTSCLVFTCETVHTVTVVGFVGQIYWS